jgi:hypothetical protein
LYAGLTTESGLIGPFDTFTVFWIAAYLYGRSGLRLRVRKMQPRYPMRPPELHL